MGDLTRRSFVKTSAGTAVGLGAVGALDIAEADAKQRAAASHPIVAWIGDPASGRITVMHGQHEVTIRDRKLVDRIARTVD